MSSGPEPRAQLAIVLLNYSSHGRGTRSRNRNNIELLCLILIQLAIGALSVRALSLLPETTPHSACSSAH